MSPEKKRAEDRRRRRITRNSREFSIIPILFHVYSNFGNLTYLIFSLCRSLIHLTVSLYLCLSVSHLLFRSLLTVSGPEGVFPLGWQQQGDRERETGRASSGEAWQTPLVIFPPPPIDSVSSGSVLAGPPSSEGLDKHALFSSSAIRENLSRAQVRGFHHCIATFPLFNIPLSSSCPCFFPTFPSFFTGADYKSSRIKPLLFTGLKLKPPAVKQPCSPTSDIAFSQ